MSHFTNISFSKRCANDITSILNRPTQWGGDEGLLGSQLQNK